MSSETGGVVIGPRALATGPVATVYAGQLADSGAEIAVKLFADRFDRDTAARLDRERRALGTVRAVRSILPVDGVVDHPDGRSGVHMELCRGSLAEVLAARDALPLRDVLRLGSTVATALAAAHRVGVVHGGVTPHNVLYRRSGDLVLADFGLALRERFPRDLVQALEYTAPETLRDSARSEASDLYGLGAVLYAAVTGTPPFSRRTGQPPGERILRVLREQVPPIRREDVPAELADLVGRLLAKDPADRPPDAASVVAVFERLSGGAPPVEAPATTPAGSDDLDDFDFDDFDGPDPGPDPDAASAVPASRKLVYTTGGGDRSKPPRARGRPALFIGLGVVVAGLTVVPIVLSQDGPEPVVSPPAVVAASARATPSNDASKVNLRLAPPVDQGSHVQLTWQADGDLDFAVVVAGERIDTMVLVANRQRTMRVPVDPTRRYCFQVRATDGRQVYTTEPLPIRGASCKL
ncbi:serine/threonine-protein kinase [Dactylosporangium sp. AC04546]|uniref:serine/threonine protein kinase n=1 Tax=Dactylosporangium sp. AC04546 TaxID=2862460 RepID=UPI001EDF10CC|nr:serine/threonine-protein kinase [Dactylosporangium sp. AC04546]WVK87316.1 serine/threonine-protein kinase [Dactylosporangium sp. AC04546]